MKVVIVDDEIFIIDMIQALVNWEKLGLTCVGVAHNGIDACNLISEQKPDIVITDIRLPGVDGLGIIKACSERDYSCKFIIISGYKQFEYAQTAMNYGVKEYLLKPIRESELNTALEKLIAEIQKKQQIQSNITESEKQLNRGKATLREGFMTQALAGEIREKSLEMLNQKYMLNFTDGVYDSLIFKIDIGHCEEKLEEDTFLRTMKEKFYEKLIAHSKNLCHELVWQERGTSIYILVNYSAEKENTLLIQQKEDVDQLTKYAAMFKGTKVTLARGTATDNLNDALESFKQTEKILWERILPGMPSVLGAQVIPEEKQEYVPSQSTQRAVKNSIINRDVYTLETVLESAFTELKIQALSGSSCRKLCLALAKMVDSILLNEKIICNIEWSERERTIENLLDSCGTYRNMKSCLIRNLTDRVESLFKEEDSGTYAVRVVKQYVANNYMKKIKLQDVAEQVYLNPVYLSVCFKREVGTNFVDYVNEYRIERAKELLRTTQDTIYSIAEQVGLPDTHYFSKIFKRYVGVSPNEYRNNAVL